MIFCYLEVDSYSNENPKFENGFGRGHIAKGQKTEEKDKDPRVLRKNAKESVRA